MNNKDYEQLLCEMLNEEIAPSEKLIIETKELLYGKNDYEKWIGLAVFVNALLFLGFIFYIMFIPHTLVTRVLLYSAITTATNAMIILIYEFREKIEETFC